MCSGTPEHLLLGVQTSAEHLFLLEFSCLDVRPAADACWAMVPYFPDREMDV